MTVRDITNYREVTKVVPEDVNTSYSAYAKAGQEIVNASAEAKVTENLSNAQLELSALQNQFKIDNEANPFDEKGLAKFNTQKQAIFDKYNSQTPILWQKDWSTKSQQISKAVDASTQAWGFEQSKVNTVNSVNTSMQNDFKLANSNGQLYGSSDDNTIDSAMNFLTSHGQLAEFGNKNLGEETTTKMLKGYNVDYMKSFIAGVAETNPKKAAAMLDDPKIHEQFTTDQRDEFVGAIQKTQKKQELQKEMQMTVNSAQVSDIVNDPQSTYFDKRLAIDKLDMQGAITPKVAASARRVLSSQKDVDAITSTPEMADVITKIYDINATADASPSEYLQGVQGIHDLILQKQADGKLTPMDAQKLNNEMKTLTSKKVSDATRSVGNDFYDANQKFNALPPEYRGDATRQLFYLTNGKELGSDQINNHAQTIIDNINKDRRNAALKNIHALTAPDLQFITTKGYTPADVTETAKKYHISESEVIRKLREK